ncbi:MAG TPA: DUF6178 family protein [Polyangiaceae bacterium]|nr:DUF6178 family protein [Polyangiaceae bacterium]
MPNLPERVRALTGPALGKLIDRVGLADAAELVALASTEQLSEIFDQDLWRSAESGVDERFVAERFLLWLEVMSEVGERFVAERLADLPQDLVVLAVHRHLWVLSLADLERELSGDEDEAYAAQKAFESCLSEELDEYQLIWRGGDGWDQLLAALVALDRDHHGLLVDLLERCAALSRGSIDDSGGLYEVLNGEEMLEDDLAGERESRRAAAGYVAPSAALSFLRLAAGPASDETPLTEHDPLTRAYFRRLDPKRATPAAPTAHSPRLLVGAAADLAAPATATESLLLQALRALADEQPETLAARAEELGYLANVLCAGASFDGRRLRPVEGIELAIQAVSTGLELACRGEPSAASAAAALGRYPCDGLLRLAFRLAGRADPKRDREAEPKSLATVRRLLKQLKL